ncbi:MAG: ABC transporter ATP-binding protein [Lachnospiraceae bacterium]|nr:ABC transporter ATP-binding protein [Lachnospiraceae bacterium]
MIHTSNIVKSFNIGSENEIEILHGIDLDIYKGEFVSIVGASGSGKSTLMNIIGILDKPTSGTYILDDRDVSEARDKELSAIRNQKIGFVFQTYNLISRTTALANVELPMMYAHINKKKRRERAEMLLEMVGMSDRMDYTPDKLSGGQTQRVAIARALANSPSIILADEPTGALDSVTGHLIMDLFHKLNEENGITIVLITHSKELAEETSKIFTLKDGNIISSRMGRGGSNASTQTTQENNEAQEIKLNKESSQEINLDEESSQEINLDEESSQGITLDKGSLQENNTSSGLKGENYVY